MITISESAAKKIKTMLNVQGCKDYGLRLGVTAGGCSGFSYKLAFEENPKDNDIRLEDNGVKIFVDMKSALYLDGAIVEYVDGLLGAGFKIINEKNAKTTCGCGESFSV